MALSSKVVSNKIAVDADSLAGDAQSVRIAAGKLKRGRVLLKQGKYDAFVDELMGDLDESDSDSVADSVEENANQWIGMINYALSRTDRAKASDSSVSFGTGKFGRDLTFVKNDDWELESTELP